MSSATAPTTQQPGQTVNPTIVNNATDAAQGSATSAAATTGKRSAPEDSITDRQLSFQEQHDLKQKQLLEEVQQPEKKQKTDESGKQDDAKGATADASKGGEGLEAMLQKIASGNPDELKSPALRSLMKELHKIQEEKKQLETLMGGILKEKKDQMKKVWEDSIRNWVADLPTSDTGIKAEFEKGIQRLCESSADKSGVWQVACCASQLHRTQVNEINRLVSENNALVEAAKARDGFASEEARLGSRTSRLAAEAAVPSPSKPEDEGALVHDFIDTSRASDVWGAFESYMRENPVYTGVPESLQ